MTSGCTCWPCSPSPCWSPRAWRTPRIKGLVVIDVAAPRTATVGDQVTHRFAVTNSGRRATTSCHLRSHAHGYSDVTVLVPALAGGERVSVKVVRTATDRVAVAGHVVVVTSTAPFGLRSIRSTMVSRRRSSYGPGSFPCPAPASTRRGPGRPRSVAPATRRGDRARRPGLAQRGRRPADPLAEHRATRSAGRSRAREPRAAARDVTSSPARPPIRPGSAPCRCSPPRWSRPCARGRSQPVGRAARASPRFWTRPRTAPSTGAPRSPTRPGRASSCSSAPPVGGPAAGSCRSAGRRTFGPEVWATVRHLRHAVRRRRRPAPDAMTGPHSAPAAARDVTGSRRSPLRSTRPSDRPTGDHALARPRAHVSWSAGSPGWRERPCSPRRWPCPVPSPARPPPPRPGAGPRSRGARARRLLSFGALLGTLAPCSMHPGHARRRPRADPRDVASSGWPSPTAWSRTPAATSSSGSLIGTLMLVLAAGVAPGSAIAVAVVVGLAGRARGPRGRPSLGGRRARPRGGGPRAVGRGRVLGLDGGAFAGRGHSRSPSSSCC